MALSRRHFLGLLAVAPAVPLISKLPVLDAPEAEALVPLSSMGAIMASGGPITASGGWCPPVSPTYDMCFPTLSRPVRDSLPPIRARR